MANIRIGKLTTKTFTTSVGTQVNDRRQGDAAKEDLPLPQSVLELQAAASKDQSVENRVNISIGEVKTVDTEGHVDFVYVDERDPNPPEAYPPVTINVDQRKFVAGTVVTDNATYIDQSRDTATFIAEKVNPGGQ